MNKIKLENYKLYDQNKKKHEVYNNPNDTYIYDDISNLSNNIDYRITDPYKKEKRYINGALVTDVTKNGSMNYNAPQAYLDNTGVGLRVIQTDRVKRDIGDSHNISIGYGTNFKVARAGNDTVENLGKSFY